MRGYGGDDLYIVDNAGDVIGETPGNGTDTVQASVSYTLAPNVENLILTGGVAINGTGNAQNNAISGNIAANVLKGGFGNDVLSGGGGNDTLFGDGGNDLMTGGSGADRFTFQDTLGAGNADHIADFATGSDKIMLENAVFASLGAGRCRPGRSSSAPPRPMPTTGSSTTMRPATCSTTSTAPARAWPCCSRPSTTPPPRWRRATSW